MSVTYWLLCALGLLPTYAAFHYREWFLVALSGAYVGVCAWVALSL